MMVNRKPIVIFDIDGTLTNYNEFVNSCAVPFFIKRYGLKVINSDALEIEEIFNLDMSDPSNKKKLNDFWVSSQFLKYTLVKSFRSGSVKYIRQLIRQGFNVYFYTSRDKTCNKNLVGRFARLMTYLQFARNGLFVRNNQIKFFQNDNAKIEAIVDSNPVYVIDDKPSVIHRLSDSGLKVLCVAGTHNKSLSNRIASFNLLEMEDAVTSLLGSKNFECAKKEADSSMFFDKIVWVSKIINAIYRPVVLHKERVVFPQNTGVIYVSNHRSTLDPIIIESTLLYPIHWAALKRFFDGEDSVFNNSKRYTLRKLTQFLMNKLKYFPIDRRSDNPRANNVASVSNMGLFLKNNYAVGIFPEGTTRRDEGKEFGEFDVSFASLAKKNNSYIQPITIYWKNKRPVVCFGFPFLVKDISKEDALGRLKKTLCEDIEECKAELNK